jgi:hypothetical protein
MNKLLTYAQGEALGLLGHLPKQDRDIVKAYFEHQKNAAYAEGKRVQRFHSNAFAGLFFGVGLVGAVGLAYFLNWSSQNAEAQREVAAIQQRCIDKVVCDCLEGR